MMIPGETESRAAQDGIHKLRELDGDGAGDVLVEVLRKGGLVEIELDQAAAAVFGGFAGESGGRIDDAGGADADE